MPETPARRRNKRRLAAQLIVNPNAMNAEMRRIPHVIVVDLFANFARIVLAARRTFTLVDLLRFVGEINPVDRTTNPP
jgi:hypothetical protein